MSLELSKTISYGTILVLVLAIIAGSIAHGETQKTISVVEEAQKNASVQHVTKESVNQLLAVRDTKLEAIVENINEIKTNQKEFQKEQRIVNRETQLLLIKILGKLPDGS